MKKIKAWTVIDLREKQKPIFYTENNSLGGYAVANIFPSKKEAQGYHKWTHLKRKMRVIPCEITYKLSEIK